MSRPTGEGVMSGGAAMLLLLMLIPEFAASAPAEDALAVTAIEHGILHTISHGVIRNGTLLIEDGRIIDLGPSLSIPEGAAVIDAAGMHVLPGFIDGFTNLGAHDLEPQNHDDDEATDPVTPHLRIIDAFNPDNRFIPSARRAGITAVLCAPGEGNLLSGQSALLRLAGGSFEDVLLRFPVAVHGSLGEPPKLRYGGKNRYPMTRMGSAALLRQTLTDAKAYAAQRERENPPPLDFKLEALVPLLKGERPLILRANRRDDILTAMRISDEFGIRLVINHGAEAYRVVAELIERDIPVIVGPVFENRMREETARAVLENPALLHGAGVKLAFQTGSFRHHRDLLLQARIAVRHGLPRDAALRALTLSPAEIFGVSDRIGSLEKGKQADLLLFEGDPLDGLSDPALVIIAGRITGAAEKR